MTTATYDGNCVLCQQTRRIIQALDWLNRVEFLNIHDWETVQARFPDEDFDTAMGAIFVFTADGRRLSGFPAMRQLLRELPLGFPFWLLLHLPGMNWMGAKVYRFIAHHRYQINRWLGVDLETCSNSTCKSQL
jgi:predicted DCC family thiol-disulfide oxidoreductase YuxK